MMPVDIRVSLLSLLHALGALAEKPMLDKSTAPTLCTTDGKKCFYSQPDPFMKRER